MEQRAEDKFPREDPANVDHSSGEVLWNLKISGGNVDEHIDDGALNIEPQQKIFTEVEVHHTEPTQGVAMEESEVMPEKVRKSTENDAVED